jgi:hypothetical protein
MRKLSIKGIIVGGIIDVLTTAILVFLSVAYVRVKLGLTHTSPSAVTTALHANTSLHVFQFLVGMACSVLGGYIGARIARHDELLNGTLTSFLCLALGLYVFAEGRVSGSPLLLLVELVASPGLGLLGGYLRLAQKRANTSTALPSNS